MVTKRGESEREKPDDVHCSSFTDTTKAESNWMGISTEASTSVLYLYLYGGPYLLHVCMYICMYGYVSVTSRQLAPAACHPALTPYLSGRLPSAKHPLLPGFRLK